MDTWAFVIIAVSLLLYFFAKDVEKKRQPVFLMTFGVGVGLLWGALWALAIVNSVIQ